MLSENAQHSRLIEEASVIPFTINHWRIRSATAWFINGGAQCHCEKQAHDMNVHNLHLIFLRDPYCLAPPVVFA